MTANWLMIAGFVFLAFGFTLRTIMMMRSSDALPYGKEGLHGRELLRGYPQAFPRSVMPWLTRGMLAAGMVLLLVGLAISFAR